MYSFSAFSLKILRKIIFADESGEAKKNYQEYLKKRKEFEATFEQRYQEGMREEESEFKLLPSRLQM